MTESLEIGTYLQNRYKIEKVLGKGGFGITYLVLDEEIGQYVVIKEHFPVHLAFREKGDTTIQVSQPEMKADYEKGVEKFLQEGRTMSMLSSVAEIAQVLNFFRENNSAYLVMEYVQGVSLRTYLERLDDMLTFSQVREMMTPVMQALEKVHKKNMLHRDLTPDNLLMREDGSIKIIDFGSAREYAEDEKTRTILVKSGYAPLEQYAKKEKQGPWTDVYALCATMYEMLTGTVPQDALKRMEHDELFLPSMFGVEISPEEEAALMKGLALDYIQRYSSMKELEAAFFPERQQRQQKKRRRFGWIGAALLVVCFAVCGTVYWKVVKNESIATEKVVYAGNYDRGSAEHTEFLDFIEARALLHMDTDLGIVYMLDEEAVLEWGQPCNEVRFSVKKDEFLDYLTDIGYTVEQWEDCETAFSESYLAAVSDYENIRTEFIKASFYTLMGVCSIQVNYDVVNEDLLSVYILEGYGEEKLIAEMAFYLTEYESIDRENRAQAKERLEEYYKFLENIGYYYSGPEMTIKNFESVNGSSVRGIVPYMKTDFYFGETPTYWP